MALVMALVVCLRLMSFDFPLVLLATLVKTILTDLTSPLYVIISCIFGSVGQLMFLHTQGDPLRFFNG